MFIICGAMSEQERKQDRGAPFKSISGTLNHLLVTDRLWLGRFYAKPFLVPSLGHELYADFEELQREREITDGAIFDWVNSLTDEALEGNLTFMTFTNPTEFTKPLWVCALHLFNHQTHHRGQLTTLIEQAGYDCGVTDLGAMPLEP